VTFITFGLIARRYSMRGVESKRIYLIEYMAARAPKWLEPFLRYRFVLRLWRQYCISRVNRMTVGEVLDMYYGVTDYDR